jgi:hypothetical protein
MGIRITIEHNKKINSYEICLNEILSVIYYKNTQELKFLDTIKIEYLSEVIIAIYLMNTKIKHENKNQSF